MAEQVLQMNISEGSHPSEHGEMAQKIAELKEIYERVQDRIKLDEETAARLNKPSKVGANLKSQNELQEWLQKQHFLSKHVQAEGSNCFSYFRPNQIKAQLGQPTGGSSFVNTELLQEVALLKLKSQRSGLQTETSSTSIKNMTYFEKMEALKLKVRETHQQHVNADDLLIKE